MENVIEKHYVPTSGGGLDANLVAALMNNNNKSLDPATVALLRDNDKGLETAALANGGGMLDSKLVIKLLQCKLDSKVLRIYLRNRKSIPFKILIYNIVINCLNWLRRQLFVN